MATSESAPSTALTTQQSAAVAQFGEMTVQAIVDRKRKLVEVMKAVMNENEHYGKIPGCGDKPTLFKSGAEVLATTFGLGPRYVVVERELPREHREYRVTCVLRHLVSGVELAEGVGTCSTMESKYRWRGGGRTCPTCGVGAIMRSKTEYGGGWYCNKNKGGCAEKWPKGAKEIEDQPEGRTENTDPADQYNTVLKMAKKRAQIDATLTAVGASDVLTQDLEDLPPGSDEIEDAEFTELRRDDRREPRDDRGYDDRRYDDREGPSYGGGGDREQPARDERRAPQTQQQRPPQNGAPNGQGRPANAAPPPKPAAAPLTEAQVKDLTADINNARTEADLKQIGIRISQAVIAADTREKLVDTYTRRRTDLRDEAALMSGAPA